MSGCTPTTLASGYSNPTGVVTDANNVYWSGGSSVYKTPLVGKSGSGTVTTLSTSATVSFNLAIDSTFLYAFTTNGFGFNTGTLVKIPIAGGNTTTMLGGQSQYGGFVAVDSSSLYWTDQSSVQRCTLPGCTNPIVLGSANGGGAIAVDNQAIYVVASGKLLRFAK